MSLSLPVCLGEKRLKSRQGTEQHGKAQRIEQGFLYARWLLAQAANGSKRANLLSCCCLLNDPDPHRWLCLLLSAESLIAGCGWEPTNAAGFGCVCVSANGQFSWLVCRLDGGRLTQHFRP